MQSLYVHFPFCESKCHYCDFYSLGEKQTLASDPDLFERALKAECEKHQHLLAPQLKTIFFGGGTPSRTPPESMARALEPLQLDQRITPETEWTMEANPSSVDANRFTEYRKLGINRISLGVQATRDEMLHDLGRVHSFEDVKVALEAIFKADFSNVSVDVLCGVPGQSQAELEKTLKTLTSFPITHLSCYLLTLPKTHFMFKRLPDENEQLAHLLLIDQWMSAQGFRHYEISNFCKPGHEARHNLAYWKGDSYLGLGPSAHSFDASKKTRFRNVKSLHRYADLLLKGGTATEETETLSPEQLELERWMLALRLDEGFPKDWLNTPLRKNRAEELLNHGLLSQHPKNSRYLRLTAHGFAMSDQVIASLA